MLMDLIYTGDIREIARKRYEEVVDGKPEVLCSGMSTNVLSIMYSLTPALHQVQHVSTVFSLSYALWEKIFRILLCRTFELCAFKTNCELYLWYWRARNCAPISRARVATCVAWVLCFAKVHKAQWNHRTKAYLKCSSPICLASCFDEWGYFVLRTLRSWEFDTLLAQYPLSWKCGHFQRLVLKVCSRA